jgi:hypothetical protein
MKQPIFESAKFTNSEEELEEVRNNDIAISSLKKIL